MSDKKDKAVIEETQETDKAVAEAMDASTEIAIIDERTIRDKIYEVRGVKVMLDFELAEIYGYTTKAFNQQVKRNSEKFEDDFMFQLTREETEELSRSQNVTSIQTQGVKGGRAYLPRAFTESGVYMLMTILKGELATQQSKALIRTFRSMKDYIIENQGMIGHREYLQLSMQISDSIRDNVQMRQELDTLSDDMKGVLDKLSDVVTKSELSPILLEMGRPEEKREYLLMNGQPAKADETYIDIYSRAKQNIIIIDDYVNIKTLRHLQMAKAGVSVVLYTDNYYNLLHTSDYTDFQKEFPGINITFQRTMNKFHDRFIVLDFNTKDERMFHCGASSKDAGNKTTSITEYTDTAVKKAFHNIIAGMKNNPPLKLK